MSEIKNKDAVQANMQPNAQSAVVPPDWAAIAVQAAIGSIAGMDSVQSSKLAAQISSGADAFLAGLIPVAPAADKASHANPALAPFASDLKLALASAEFKHRGAVMGAEEELRAAVSAWNLAKHQYDFDVQAADMQLRVSTEAAANTYRQKNNPDSHSRVLFLYYTMKQTVASDIQAFDTSLAASAATLAAAGGSLLAAYVTYLTAVSGARVIWQEAVAAANVQYWQNVEATLDAD